MYTTENTNAVVKVGRRYVCHLPWQQPTQSQQSQG
jgi:hypothetical protein